VVLVEFYYVLLPLSPGPEGAVEYERVGLGVTTVEYWFDESPARLISLI
jgi:hypothetical protein